MSGKIGTLFNKLSKNGYSLVFLLSAIGAVISFGLSSMLAASLGAAKYGYIQYYVGVINTLSLFLQFGLPSFMVKNTQFESNNKKFVSNYFAIYNIISIVSAPIFFVVAYFLLGKIQKDIIVIAVIFVCSYLYSLSLLFCNYFSGLKKFKLSTFLESVLPKLLMLIFFGVIVIIGRSAIINNIYLYVFGGTYLVICLPILFKNIRLVKIKLPRNSAAVIAIFFLISVTGSLNANIAKVFQGDFFDNDAALGIYSISMQIVNLGTLFSAVVTNISKPFFAKYAKDNEPQKLMDYYAKTIRLCSYISIPFMLAFIFQADKVLSLFGESYSGVPIILILSCVYGILISITGPCGTLLGMVGREKLDLLSGLISVIAFVLFAFVLKNFTILAIPIAMIISCILSKLFSILSIVIIYKKNPFPIKTIIYLLIVALVSSDIFYGLSRISNLYLWLAFNLIIGAIIILASFFFSPFSEDKYFFLRNEDK